MAWRPGLLEALRRWGADTVLHDHATGTPRAVSAEEVRQLLDVEVANLQDQLPQRGEVSPKLERYMLQFDARVRSQVSAAAAAAMAGWLAGGLG